jgi:inorganic pyrophosphatase
LLCLPKTGRKDTGIFKYPSRGSRKNDNKADFFGSAYNFHVTLKQLGLSLHTCSPNFVCHEMDHLALPSFSERGHLQAVIEIPAGTNTKFEYNKKELRFEPDIRNGVLRRVDFMSYPVNYGFIPSTKMDKARAGDGDPLDALVLAEHLPTATVIEIKPIGLLRLKDLGELDHKVLAIPVDPSLRIIKADDWTSFQQSYSAIRHILEMFFMYYDGLGTMTVLDWGDGAAALQEVDKWQTK